MTGWIVAHCHANAEFKAEVHLKRQGFDVFLPRYKTTRRHARRVETVIRPLFPRYLFIKFDEQTTHWRPIRSTVGISHIISAGERPLIAPPWVVEQLRQRQDDDGMFSSVPKLRFEKGDAVQITDGAFSDRRGIFDGLNNSQRVAVLLDVMGRQVRTLVPSEAVRWAG